MFLCVSPQSKPKAEVVAKILADIEEKLTVAPKLILKFNCTYRQFTSGKR